MKRLLESEGVAIFIITSLSLALLACLHLTTGFVDYGLLFLCVIYLLAFLLALALSGSLRGVSQRNKKDAQKNDE